MKISANSSSDDECYEETATDEILGNYEYFERKRICGQNMTAAMEP